MNLSDAHLHHAALGRELDRVRHEVADHPVQRMQVRGQQHPLARQAYPKSDATLLRLVDVGVVDASQQRTELHQFDVHRFRTAVIARRGEQMIQCRTEHRHRGLRLLGRRERVMVGGCVQSRTGHLQVRHRSRHRLPEIMADRGDQSRLLRVRLLRRRLPLTCDGPRRLGLAPLVEQFPLSVLPQPRDDHPEHVGEGQVDRVPKHLAAPGHGRRPEHRRRRDRPSDRRGHLERETKEGVV